MKKLTNPFSKNLLSLLPFPGERPERCPHVAASDFSPSPGPGLPGCQCGCCGWRVSRLGASSGAFGTALVPSATGTDPSGSPLPPGLTASSALLGLLSLQSAVLGCLPRSPGLLATAPPAPRRCARARRAPPARVLPDAAPRAQPLPGPSRDPFCPGCVCRSSRQLCRPVRPGQDPRNRLPSPPTREEPCSPPLSVRGDRAVSAPECGPPPPRGMTLFRSSETDFLKLLVKSDSFARKPSVASVSIRVKSRS